MNSRQQVHLQYWYPDSASLYSDHGYQYINNGVTYPSFGGDHVSMTVTDNQLTVNFLYDVEWTTAEFNGWVLTDITGGLDFSDARILQSSVSTSLFTLTSTTTTISVNWAGSYFSISDVIVIGFNSRVLPSPSPSSPPSSRPSTVPSSGLTAAPFELPSCPAGWTLHCDCQWSPPSPRRFLQSAIDGVVMHDYDRFAVGFMACLMMVMMLYFCMYVVGKVQHAYLVETTTP